tara:strand:+ start:815 stop:931 length:117 start_codon:yes stop_codon:yes gene_type:complete
MSIFHQRTRASIVQIIVVGKTPINEGFDQEQDVFFTFK